MEVLIALAVFVAIAVIVGGIGWIIFEMTFEDEGYHDCRWGDGDES